MKTDKHNESTRNPEFKNKTYEIIKNNGDVLVLSRYFANKDFFLMTTQDDFDIFLEQRNTGEAITVFKSYEKLKKEIVSKLLISELKTEYDKQIIKDWLVILKEGKDNQISGLISDTEELIDIVEDCEGHEIIIIKEPDWFDEKETLNAYVPNENGEVVKIPY